MILKWCLSCDVLFNFEILQYATCTTKCSTNNCITAVVAMAQVVSSKVTYRFVLSKNYELFLEIFSREQVCAYSLLCLCSDVTLQIVHNTTHHH